MFRFDPKTGQIVADTAEEILEIARAFSAGTVAPQSTIAPVKRPASAPLPASPKHDATASLPHVSRLLAMMQPKPDGVVRTAEVFAALGITAPHTIVKVIASWEGDIRRLGLEPNQVFTRTKRAKKRVFVPGPKFDTAIDGVGLSRE